MGNQSARKPKIKLAPRRAFIRALEEIGPTNLCGFSLSTNESAMSLVASINTDEHLKTVTAGDEMEAAYYRWSPPEWHK